MSAARATIFGCLGTEVSPRERAFFSEAQPWGFILFARNLADADQIRALTTDLRESVGRDAPILIDQEGGRVARLRPPLATEWLPPLDFGQSFDDPRARAEAFYARYLIIAAELLALGIDVNCAPMADIPFDQTHEIIRNRCYSLYRSEIGMLAHHVARGLLDGGVLPILKHIPGHGRTALDSHHDLPVIDVPLEVLREIEFRPFREAAHIRMGMTAHIVYPALDADNPATLSKTVINEIRGEIGFDGLLMTDDLSMKALGGPFDERVRRALDAGCDMILHCNGDGDEMAAVSDAAPVLTGRALARAEAALAQRKTAGEVDIPALLRQIETLRKEPLDA